jgi:peptide deformylase
MLEILKYPDSRLKIKCLPVKSVTPELVDFAQKMIETMYASNGIGLAAAQVNKQIRLLVVDTRPRGEKDRYELSQMTALEKLIDQPLVLFNPKILSKEGNTTYEEGCLSVPTYFESVDRFEFIEVEALNLKGELINIKTDGLLSICIQHEIDHLDGKLFIDRLSTIKGTRIKNKIKKFGYPKPGENMSEETELEEFTHKL